MAGPRAAELLLRPRRVGGLDADPATEGADRPEGSVPPKGLNPWYTRHSYRLAIQRACVKAGGPVWSPNQLRQPRATQIRAAYGSIEAAKAVLGHTDTRVTEIYAERNLALATRVIK